MPYSIIASDLDGTLLTPAHVISTYTQQILKKLVSCGKKFVFATGRHYVDVAAIRANFGIEAYMITSNGARVHDAKGQMILAYDLPGHIVSEIVNQTFDRTDMITNLYCGDYWLSNRPHPETYKEAFPDSAFNYTLFDKSNIPTLGVSKVFFSSENHTALLELEEELKQYYGSQVNISFSSLDSLEIMAYKVSKGHALAEVAKNLGYGLTDCIAFGDGMNDYEMLSMVGKGCVMGNAAQRLKDSLPGVEVIGANADDAVAHYLSQLYQLA